MSDQKHKILSMLAEGKISVEQAEKLMAAIDVRDSCVSGSKTETAAETKPKSGKRPKFLRVLVTKDNGHDGQNVNIKVPLALIRAGVKLGAMMPGSAKDKVSKALEEKGIAFDLNDISGDDLETILTVLTETSIDVQDGKENVKIYCE